MLGKIPTSLIRLYGRIKSKMADWFMSYAGSYTPLGMVIWLFTYENLKGGAYWVGVVAGTIMVIAGVVALLISWGEVKKGTSKKTRGTR